MTRRLDPTDEAHVQGLSGPQRMVVTHQMQKRGRPQLSQ